MRMSKRGGIIGGVFLLFWVTIAVAVILIVFVVFSAVLKATSYVPFSSGSEKFLESEMDLYMKSYEGKIIGLNSCILDENLMVLNPPCSCISEEGIYEICNSGEYCYNGGVACDDFISNL